MRKRNLWIGTLAAAAMVCSIGARIQSATQSSTSRSQPDQTITVTGCLEQGSQTAGTSGTTGSPSAAGASARSNSDNHFILTNAGIRGSMPGTTSGTTTGTTSETTTGTTGSSTASSSTGSSSGMTYMLDGKSKELRDHVNQEVQITGKLDTKSSSRTTSSTGATTTATTATGGTTATGTTTTGTTPTGGTTTRSSAMGTDGPRLKVNSVRPIAATCSNR